MTESALHLVQLALLGCAILLAMAFEPGMVPALFLAGLVLAHALVGYLDSRTAFTAGRVVRPIEQHIHSVLDMAPMIAFGIFVVLSWSKVVAPGSGIELRQSPLSIGAWAWVACPALVLCAFPAIMEFRSAWMARRSRQGNGALDARPAKKAPA